MGASPATLPAYDLFVAYADADASWVQGCLLPSLGLPPGRSITKHDFRLGAALVSEFERAITQSRFTVLVLSPEYLRDEWANFQELIASYWFVSLGMQRLIPILLEDTDLPVRIDFRIRLDCRNEANWKPELKRLRELLERPEPEPRKIECPYPGIRPFGAKEAPYFFGRQPEIDLLAARVLKESFLVVLGPSGSGKSSLVFSGVVAKLERDRPGYWLVESMRPGTQPLEGLANKLQAKTGAKTDWKSTGRAFLESRQGAGRLLLVIDQFEEVLFLAAGEKSEFASALQEISSDRDCVVLLTLRSDFYTPFLEILRIDPSQQVNILPLRGASLRDAIVKPAAAMGVWLEEKLVDRLMADAADEKGVLPMLQETMNLLWDKMDQSLITLNAYLNLDEKQPGLVVALRLQGGYALGHMNEAQRRIARRILLRLVQFGEGRDDTRRQQKLEALHSGDDPPADFQKALDVLVEFRILTLDTDPQAPDRTVVDLAHEALITGWPVLHDLIRDRRNAEMSRRRLCIQAEEWERLGKKQGGLLDKTELAEARNWLATAEAGEVGVDPEVTDLIEASRRAMRSRRLIGTFAVIVVGAFMGVAGAMMLQSRSEEAFVQNLNDIDSQRTASPDAALKRAIDVVAKSPQRKAALNQQAAAVLEDCIQASEPFGVTSVPGGAFAASLSSDGRLVAAAGGTVKIQDLVSGDEPDLGHPAFTESLFAVQIAPGASGLSAAGADGKVVTWDRAFDQPGKVVSEQKAPIFSVAYSPDGRHLAIGREDGGIVVLDLAAGKEQKLASRAGRINRLSYSRNGAYLAAGAADDTTKPSDLGKQGVPSANYTAAIWVTAGGMADPKWILGGHHGEVRSVSFDDGSRVLATVAADGYLRTWDVALGRLLTEDLIPAQKVGSGQEQRGLSDVVFIGPQTVAVSFSSIPEAVIWNLQTHRIEAILQGHSQGLTALSYSPAHGGMLATASQDGRVRVHYLDIKAALAHARVLWNARNNHSQ
jgi:hypothetical protein